MDAAVELMEPARLNAALRTVPEDLAQRVAAYLDTLTSDQLSAIRGLGTRLAVITESVAGPYLRAQPGRGTVDLRDCLTGGSVVLFSLNSSSYGQLAAHIGGLVIQDLKTAIGDLLQHGAAAKALVFVDEFSALDGDHLLSLLARARQSGAGVLLGTQELADLERVADGFCHQVLGNTATKIAHRQDVPESADTLAGIAGTRQAWQYTHQTSHSVLGYAETGVAAKRLSDEYLAHPNIFKRLHTGRAVLITKHPEARVRIVQVIAGSS